MTMIATSSMMRIVAFFTCLSLCLASSERSRSLIVGGIEVPKGSRPYQVALSNLVYMEDLFCGGTLVHPKWVVSAAHCVFNSEVFVGFGYHDLRDEPADGVVEIKGKWHRHPDFDFQTLDNDIALIELDTAVTLTDRIQPIGIANAGSDVTDGTKLLVSGWGRRSAGGQLPWELRQVVVNGINRNQCDKKYINTPITDNMICAADKGKDACQGDSGGPLVSHFDEKVHQDGVILEGIVSWGWGCADSSFPGIYTRVANYCSWIATETSDEVTCKTETRA